MQITRYAIWQDGEFFVGYLNDYPEYLTQGYSKEELVENLDSLLDDIKSGEIPYVCE
jgi:predicted RNase H-like HicB family nuclease